MNYEELEKLAIKVVNLLAENNVIIADVNRVFKLAEDIIQLETKVKKIEV